MTLATLRSQLGIESPKVVPQPLPNGFLRGLQAPLKGLLNRIRDAIRDDTLTVAQIDSFIHENLDRLPASKKQQILGFLLSKKAFLLFRDGHEAKGLEFYDEALKVNEAPSTWTLKGTALLQMERLDEAFQSFEKAFSLRENFGDQKQEYLKLLEEAKAENLQTSVVNLAFEEPVDQELRDALEELELMVRLLSIKDPFEGWRALTKELTNVWPTGVSAVDAVREQRE